MNQSGRIAFCRGRINAYAKMPSTPPSDILSDADKKAFLAGYNKEMRNPSIEKEMEKYPTQLSRKAVDEYERLEKLGLTEPNPLVG